MSQDPLDVILSSVPAMGAPVLPQPFRTKKGAIKFQPESDWSIDRLPEIESEFQQTTGRPLPVRVRGQGKIHDQWGYQHQDSADISLSPNSREGQALMAQLQRQNIPYLAFDRAIPNVATGPHIHIGRPSKHKGAPAPASPGGDDLDALLQNVPPGEARTSTTAAPQQSDDLDKLLEAIPSGQSIAGRGARQPRRDRPFIPAGPLRRVSPEQQQMLRSAVDRIQQRKNQARSLERPRIQVPNVDEILTTARQSPEVEANFQRRERIRKGVTAEREQEKNLLGYGTSPTSIIRNLVRSSPEAEVESRVQAERDAEEERLRVESQLTPEDIAQTKAIAEQLRKHGPGVKRGMDKALQGVTSSLLYKLAGLTDIPTLGQGDNPAGDWLRRKALAGELSIEEVADLPQPEREQIAQFLTGMVAGLPEITAATAIGGPVGGFAALHGSEAIGRGQPAQEVVKETAKGATLGAVFKGAGRTGSIPKELGTIGAGTAATELAFGATPEEAAQSAGANVLFAGGMKALGGRRTKETELPTPAPPIEVEHHRMDYLTQSPLTSEAVRTELARIPQSGETVLHAEDGRVMRLELGPTGEVTASETLTTAPGTLSAHDYQMTARALGVETAAPPAKVPLQKPVDTRRPEDFLPSFFRVKSSKGETIAPEQAYAGTIQGAEISEPRRPTRPTVAGAETQISIPDSAEKYPARYTVREAEDVEASHEHQSFNPNQNYHYTNDRNYASNSEYRMRVMERSGTQFDPREVVNTSPTLDTGPPAWDAEGNALGGNSRVMILKRVYDKGGEGAARYKEEVMRQASLLGIDPEAVAKMERPILGRELIDEKTDYQRAISNLNRPSAAPLTSDELSSAQAKQLRPEMADYIARKIEDSGEAATVASMMDEHGADIINRMVDEGLISPPERNTLLKSGKVTPEAKKRIERLLTSAVYRDLKQMQETPPVVRANVERLAPSMMRIAETEWDLKPLVQSAIDAIQEAKATGQTLDKLASQQSFAREPYSAETIQMAKVLLFGPRKVAQHFRGYANDLAMEKAGGGLFGAPSREESMATHFGIVSQIGEPARMGPGAANLGDVPGGSVTKQLTEAIKNSDAAPRDRISLSLNLADRLSAGKDAIERGLIKSRALTQSLWARYKGPTDVSADQKILGDFQYKLQKSAFEARKFAKTINDRLSPAQQEYITNYIQADGDAAVLRQRAEMTRPGPTKLGYRKAASLTEEEKALATQFSSAFESLFREANDSGVAVSFIENYVPQLWGERTKASKVMLADAQRGMLDPTFKFSKKRVFESYFEGEQLSYKPKTKSIGALYQIYTMALHKAIASRQYIADLQQTNGSDGRPLVAIRGAAQTPPLTEGPPPEAKGAFVKPHKATAETSDYRVLNHPAMRGWKYVTSIDGKPVMLEGDMAIHPEAYKKIRNVLTPSKIATGEGLAFKGIRVVKRGQSIAKQTMLGFFSPFHQVQEDVHALGHKSLPYINKTEIDFDNPQQQRLLKGGLQVASWNEAEAFSEGLSGGNLTARIPLIGTKLLGPYQEWLFKDHIPNLKMNMALHALKRNTKRYEGKLSPERIAELTASQANNAFGELNYAYMGRNQTFQDSLRILLLAPDFLEARARFAGSALKGQGKEQLDALLLLAATQYITARILNKLSDDDYHWEHENAFVVVHHGKAYGLRSVPSDVLELAEDPRRFLTHRSSPLTAAGVRAYTGKNEFGRPVDVTEQAKLLAQSPVPIQFKGLFYKKDMVLWDSFLSSMGIRVTKDKSGEKTRKEQRAK